MTAENKKYSYKLHLNGLTDLIDFVKTASTCPYDVTLVSGSHRLNGKSFLGVFLAKVSWEDLYVEADRDCYFDLEQFIA